MSRRTLVGVISAASCFARIVHQQSQKEEIETVDLGQQCGEALLPVLVRLAQAVNVVNYQEGVLIDGIAMVGIADHQRIDAVELGDQQLQNA
jgi:hypothetical protein